MNFTIADSQEEVKGNEASNSRSATSTIDSANIGFQLLKKHGWKEGTGLGISEQGRLEPVQVHLKNNKRGLGADKAKKAKKKVVRNDAPDVNNKEENMPSKKLKAQSKRMKKMLEREQQLQEKEFERAFFREFWPDNV